MPNKIRSSHEAPEKPSGECWLYSHQQQRLVHFKPSMASEHAQWGAVRTCS